MLIIYSYAAHIASIIAKAQITNGGPVILYQPENEYSGASEGVLFPNKPYMQYVIDQARNAGIVVPLINNDAFPGGTSAPGTGLGSVDIYVCLPDWQGLTRWHMLTRYRAMMVIPLVSTVYVEKITVRCAV